MTRARAVAAALVVLLPLGLAGCSGSSDADTTSASEAASDAAGVAWSPCDGITAAQVSKIAGTALTMSTGTTESPACMFLPKKKGAIAFDVSYLFFDGGLDTALKAMGTAGTQLESVEVPGATAARIAVKTRKNAIAVTGFVETDGLVQSVNAAQLAPYDEDQVVAATQDLLAALAAAAPTSSGD